MLAKRVEKDLVEAVRGSDRFGSAVYRSHLSRRRLSIHARFVAQALDVFAGSGIVENIPRENAIRAQDIREVSR